MAQPNTVKNGILSILSKNGGEMAGTWQLWFALNCAGNKMWFIRQARKLEAAGLITIMRSGGGRGNKTIYKLAKSE